MKLVNRGFTVVELLVVIVVISILIGAALPNLFSMQKRARDTRRKNDLKNLQAALESYYTDKVVYPSQLTDIEPDYLAEVPPDPLGNAYGYTPLPDGCTTNCASYTLTADLENNNDPAANAQGEYDLASVNQ